MRLVRPKSEGEWEVLEHLVEEAAAVADGDRDLYGDPLETADVFDAFGSSAVDLVELERWVDRARLEGMLRP